MASQTFTLPAIEFFDGASTVQWFFASGDRPEIDAALLEVSPGFLGHISIQRLPVPITYRINLNLRQTQTGSDDVEELTTQFEEHGSITITAAGNTLTFDTEHDDTSDPYAFVPSNVAEVEAFYNALNGLGDGSTAGTLTLDDNASAIYVASTQVSTAYVGPTALAAAYVGSTKVF